MKRLQVQPSHMGSGHADLPICPDKIVAPLSQIVANPERARLPAWQLRRVPERRQHRLQCAPRDMITAGIVFTMIIASIQMLRFIT